MTVQIKQGDGFYAQLQWCNQLGQPRDLTNTTPVVKLVDYRGNPTVAFDMNIIEATSGLFEIKHNTNTIPLGNYYLELIYQAGTLKTTTMPLAVKVVLKRTMPPLRHYKIEAFSGFTKLLLRDNTEQASIAAFAADWSNAGSN